MSTPVEHRIRVVCSDEGRHRPRLLAEIVVTGETVHLAEIPRGDPPSIERRWQRPPSQAAEVGGRWRLVDGGTEEALSSAPVWRFNCPNCWKTPEISDTRWNAVWVSVADSGVTRVDISRMPL